MISDSISLRFKRVDGAIEVEKLNANSNAWELCSLPNNSDLSIQELLEQVPDSPLTDQELLNSLWPAIEFNINVHANEI